MNVREVLERYGVTPEELLNAELGLNRLPGRKIAVTASMADTGGDVPQLDLYIGVQDWRNA